MTEWTYGRLCDEMMRLADYGRMPSLLVVSADLALRLKREVGDNIAYFPGNMVTLGIGPDGLGDIARTALTVGGVPVLAAGGATRPVLVWLYDGRPVRVEVLT